MHWPGPDYRVRNVSAGSCSSRACSRSRRSAGLHVRRRRHRRVRSGQNLLTLGDTAPRLTKNPSDLGVIATHSDNSPLSISFKYISCFVLKKPASSKIDSTLFTPISISIVAWGLKADLSDIDGNSRDGSSLRCAQAHRN